MKKVAKCKKCGNQYDNYLPECPICNKNNDTSPLDKKFLKMIFLTDYKEFLLFLTGFLGLALFIILLNLGFSGFKVETVLKNALVYFIGYMLTVAVMLCIIAYDFKRIVARIKEIRPLIVSLVAAALIILFSLIYSVILNAAGVKIISSENQSAVTKVVKGYPALAFFFVVIFGPVAEEFAYRLGAYSYLRKRNRYLAYAVTIIIFTIIHINFFSTNLKNECLNIPVYIFPSFILCLVYEYEGLNAAIYTHMLNNLISFIITLAQ